MAPTPNPYEIQGAVDGLNDRSRELFRRVFEDAAKHVPIKAKKSQTKNPGPLLDDLRTYLRTEVGPEGVTVADALAYFCSAAKATGMATEAYAVELYGRAYLRKVSGSAGGGAGGRLRELGGHRGGRGDEEL